MTKKRSFRMSEEDWSALEYFISENLQPVKPREGFVSDLRHNLDAGEFSDLTGLEKTKSHILTLVFIVSSLVVLAVIARIVAGIVSGVRKQH